MRSQQLDGAAKRSPAQLADGEQLAERVELGIGTSKAEHRVSLPSQREWVALGLRPQLQWPRAHCIQVRDQKEPGESTTGHRAEDVLLLELPWRRENLHPQAEGFEQRLEDRHRCGGSHGRNGVRSDQLSTQRE